MGKILIVDDEKGMQITLGSFLRNDGHEADTASNAREALDLVAANAYDVIVTDIVMPMMTGIQAAGSSPVVRAIREKLPEVVPEQHPETVATAIRIGAPAATSVVPKPEYREGI